MTKKTNATKLRTELFSILDQVQKGASILIERDGAIVARLVPAGSEASDDNWRAPITKKVRYLVDKKRAFAPIKDVFDVD